MFLFFLWALMIVPPLLAGLGVISPVWIVGSGIAAFLRSILDTSKRVGGDYRQLSDEQFLRADKAVHISSVIHVIGIGISYGFGAAIAYLFL